MSLNRRLTLSCASAAFGLAVGMAFSALPAQAQEEGVPLDTQIVRGILGGLGLERADQQSTINYQERPPLVLPPSRDLPPPISASAAAKNPAWPKDPDVAQSKLAAEQARKRANGFDEYERESRQLPPDQIDISKSNPEAVARARQKAQAGGPGTGDLKYELSPSELGYKSGSILKNMFKGKDNEAVRFTGEPARADLTAPPPGYQTPSPDQPYGVGKATLAAPKDSNYTTRGEMKSGL
jgi:hypothetical protein